MAAVIPKLEQLSSKVFRVLGCNPGPKTLQGTNTYLIGAGNSKILLDTGQGGVYEYIENLKSALKSLGNACIDKIIISHWHPDHIGGIPDVLQECAQPHTQVYKFKSKNHSDDADALGFNYSYIKDRDIFTAQDVALTAYYTPGHSDDHVIFAMEDDAGSVIFSGDCILGEGTAVFEDLSHYMSSLNVILSLNPCLIYPGHGPVLSNPSDRIRYYISHRMEREQQILNELVGHSQPLTAMELVKLIYKDTPANLHHAAEGNVILHLRKLLDEDKIEFNEGGSGLREGRWKSKM